MIFFHVKKYTYFVTWKGGVGLVYEASTIFPVKGLGGLGSQSYYYMNSANTDLSF